MKKKIWIIALLSLISSIILYAGIIQKDVFCRTWYPQKYVDANGKVFLPTKSQKTDYLRYNCDGTLESLENGLKIKGQWIYNNKTNELISTQIINNKYPHKIVTKVISVNQFQLVLQGPGKDGRPITIYMTSLK